MTNLAISATMTKQKGKTDHERQAAKVRWALIAKALAQKTSLKMTTTSALSCEIPIRT